MFTLLMTVFVTMCVGVYVAHKMDRALDLPWLPRSVPYAMMFGMVAAIETLKRRAKQVDPLGVQGRRF